MKRLDEVIDRINRIQGSETIVPGSQQYTRKDGKGKADIFANSIKHDYRSPNPTTRWSEVIKLSLAGTGDVSLPDSLTSTVSYHYSSSFFFCSAILLTVSISLASSSVVGRYSRYSLARMVLLVPIAVLQNRFHIQISQTTKRKRQKSFNFRLDTL